jgi:hypothetical protein
MASSQDYLILKMVISMLSVHKGPLSGMIAMVHAFSALQHEFFEVLALASSLAKEKLASGFLMVNVDHYRVRRDYLFSSSSALKE